MSHVDGCLEMRVQHEKMQVWLGGLGQANSAGQLR